MWAVKRKVLRKLTLRYAASYNNLLCCGQLIDVRFSAPTNEMFNKIHNSIIFRWQKHTLNPIARISLHTVLFKILTLAPTLTIDFMITATSE